MSLSLLLIIILIILLIGAAPNWPHTRDRGWGYYPSGFFGVVVVVLIVLLLMGRI